jgi:hypothetical protein
VRRIASILCLAAIAWPGAAPAKRYHGTIEGDVLQATTCAAPSTSRVRGSVRYDDVTGDFSWSYRYGDNAPDYDNGALHLGGAETMAHFHGPAPPGLRAGIRVFLSTGTPNDGSTTISPSLGTELLDGLWYLNIHATQCLAGELRAQVSFAPTLPSASAMFALGLTVALLGVACGALYRTQGAGRTPGAPITRS